MRPSLAPRVSFKAQMLKVREDAIVATVGRLLAERGFEAMTVDEVAVEVGIAKASLYKHFPGKEYLAAAAVVKLLRQALELCATLPTDAAPLQNLRAVLEWALQGRLAGAMPALPSKNSTLRSALLASHSCRNALGELSARLGAWVEAAQAQGTISAELPASTVVYTLYARACDPLLEFLKADGQLDDAQAITLALRTCFDGLGAR